MADDEDLAGAYRGSEGDDTPDEDSWVARLARAAEQAGPPAGVPAQPPPRPAPHQLDVVTPSGTTTYTYGPGGRLDVGGQAAQRPPPMSPQEAATRAYVGDGPQASLRQQMMSPQERLAVTRLSFPETVRLQKLQQGKSAVQEQLASGAITPETADALSLRLQTGIDPMLMRQHQAEALHREIQNRAQEAELSRQKQLGEAMRAEQPFTLPDGSQIQMYLGRNGEKKIDPVQHEMLKNHLEIKKIEAQAEARPERKEKPFDYSAARRQVMSEVKAKYQGKEMSADQFDTELERGIQRLEAEHARRHDREAPAAQELPPPPTGHFLQDAAGRVQWTADQARKQTQQPAAAPQPAPAPAPPAAPPPQITPHLKALDEAQAKAAGSPEKAAAVARVRQLLMQYPDARAVPAALMPQFRADLKAAGLIGG